MRAVAARAACVARIAALVGCAAAAGCAKGHGLLTLTVDAASGTLVSDVDHLTIRVTDPRGRAAQPFDVTVTGGAIPPAQKVSLAFDSDVSGTVQISVQAVNAAGIPVASGDGAAIVKTFASTTASVALVGTAMGDVDMAIDCNAMPPTATAKFVINKIFLPQQRSDWAYDLNGDARVDNQYGNILGALAAQGPPLDGAQADLDSSVASGNTIVLVAARSRDALFAADPCALADVYNGTPQLPPNYSGNGTFSIDAALSPGHFRGIIGGGATNPPGQDMAATPYGSAFFDAESPASTTMPAALVLPLAFGTSGVIKIPIVGAHIQYAYATDRLVAGKINGAMRDATVQAVMIPALAMSFDMQANRTPCDSSCMQIRSIFDTGGQGDPACQHDMAMNTCKNPDGTCALAGDGRISICEVSSSGLIKNVLAPDVQMFDAQGNYHPNAANTTKDSLSVGVGFLAVRASF